MLILIRNIFSVEFPENVIIYLIQLYNIIHIVCILLTRSPHDPDLRVHCAGPPSFTVSSRQDACSRGHAYIISSGQNLRLSRRGVRPGNCDNENESTSVIVSVQQSGRLLVPTDNPLSVGLVSNNTTTMTEESSCPFIDLTEYLNILKRRWPKTDPPGSKKQHP